MKLILQNNEEILKKVMKARPLRKLLVIFLITLLGLYISLPPELPIKFNKHISLGLLNKEIKIDYTFRRKDLDLQIGSFSFRRDLELKLGLDLAGGSHLVFEADTSALNQEDRKAAVDAARDTIERRVNIFGVSEAQVATSRSGNLDRIIVELPGVKDSQGAISLIGQTAQLDFRELKESTASAEEQIFLTLENTVSTNFTGADFKRARPAFDTTAGKPIIEFEIKSESVQKFADVTTRLQGKPLVIFLDQFPISAPVVQTPITGGVGQITGQFSTEQTRQLANLLNSGALPLPIKLIEQRTVEASLGEESIRASIAAGLVGLGMVVLFMVMSYGTRGVISVAGLFVYGVVTLALYKLMPVVLTLPGVAGFILSVGMAVDSNILIFERLKEELRAGKPYREAMEVAFGRAWDSIRDANIATILTSLIILNPMNLQFLHTSGPVRGFALTLLLGVLLSLFTGIFVTRTLMRTFVRR